MVIIAGIVIVLVVVFLLKSKTATNEVYSRFGVSESTHTILSTDLGKSNPQLKLTRFGVSGIADAVFKARSRKTILVGEFKSRKYRQEVRLAELYQLILYLGHIKAQYPDYEVVGCLAYADSRVKVNFDKAVYDGLIGLKDEYWESVKKGRPVNKTPLHKRINVRAENRSLVLSAKL